MFKSIKKIWRNLHFGAYPVLNFAKRLYYLLFLMGLVLAVLLHFYEKSGFDVERKVNVALNTKWEQKADEIYLNVHFSVNEIPFLFNKDNMKEIITPIIKAHNYQTRAMEANRRNGLVVKDDIRFSDVVKVYYTDDVKVDGKTTTTLWLISEKYLLNRGLENTWAKYEVKIP